MKKPRIFPFLSNADFSIGHALKSIEQEQVNQYGTLTRAEWDKLEEFRKHLLTAQSCVKGVIAHL